MRLRLAIACVALVATVSAEQSATQSDPSATATGVVRGVIRDASTGRPIRGAEVRIEGPPIPVRAVESLQSGSERDFNTLERLRSGATAVTLKDQESANITLRLTP